MSEPAGYYRQPTIHRDRIVFVCEDDLWTVGAGGGTARRLTTTSGGATFPSLSPDGKRVAFTGRDDGPAEVYVMDAAGGVPERLTFLGGLVRTVGWSPDGRRVVFQSNHDRPFPGDMRLREIPAAGGPIRTIPWGPVREISRERAGPGVVIGVNSGDPARWKRYRGGTAGRIWIDRTGRGDFEPLVDLPGNLAAPMWIGARIWFLSDHEGWGNLYSCTPHGRRLQRHTDHDDFYVRFPATDGRRIVYHAGADLWVFDVRTKAGRRVAVSVRSPRRERGRKYVPAARWLEDACLHPAGLALGCTVRGGTFTVALWEGAPKRHGEVSSARYRLLRWLPDGKRIACVTDEGGEEAVVVTAVAGGRRKRLRRRVGRAVDLAVAPRGGRLAVANHRHEVWVADVDGGQATRIERSPWARIQGLAWSPDGRWLAYGIATSRAAVAIHLYDSRRRKVHAVTRPEFGDFGPSFDPLGRYLYFLSRRIYDPVYDQHYFDLGFPRGVVPCLVPLAKGTPSPFLAAHKAPRAPRPAGVAEPARTKSVPAKVVVDLAGIEDRVVRFPVPEGRYQKIAGTDKRVFFTSLPVEGSLGKPWYDAGEPPAKAKLEVWDLDRDRVETLLAGVTTFSLSLDRKTLLVRAGNRLRALPAAVKPKMISPKTHPGRDTGWVDVGRLRVAVDPAAEWRQMFREAWRLQRDHFWTPDMGQVDWRRVHDRYLPLVDRVASRSEFSDLLWEMQGELGTSHCYELGGDYRPSPRWFQGFLGADLAYDRRTRTWRIERIPRGDSWAACSPLAAPGLGIREGEAILAIDGRPLSSRVSPGACLVHQAGREVELVLGGRSRRRVTVKTLATEVGLRYRDWVEGNRGWVHRRSRGRFGYVHIPDMGPRGYSEFHRYYRQEVDHEGLVIDVRWNGGGHVSQLLLEKLLRKRIGYDAARWQDMESYPADAPLGPMVALTNEYAGSDGDMFSHAFKLLGLGPLIGKRTWGGVIGIWPRHALVDGTITTQAEFASWFVDVGYGVENYGTDPDIEVDIRPQDHRRGRDPQLERAVAELRRLVKAQGPRLPELPAAPPRRPPRLTPR